MRRLVLAIALFLGGSAAFAQGNRYEQLYGEPVDVSVDDLINNPRSYEDRAVRTKGNLDLYTKARGLNYSLRGLFGSEILVIPVPDVQFEFESEAKTWMGREVELTGRFSVYAVPGEGEVRYQIQFWSYTGPPDRPTGKEAPPGSSLSLEKLVERPGKFDGKTVRVVGKFRGRNLYGDLPTRSQRSRADWVIKDDVYAIWVTGKKPKGGGWELDATLKRDTGKWIEVVGRVETTGGVTYVRAVEVALTSAPTPTADAQPPPPPPEKPKVPPVVVFALPLDGEREVPEDSKFRVQFSKDMDEASFGGHVVLRYAPPRQAGDRALDAVRLSYDGGRRALTVDPGDVLRSGRLVELVLLPGIVDVDGLALEPRPGKMAGEAVDILRFRVAPPAFLAGP